MQDKGAGQRDGLGALFRRRREPGELGEIAACQQVVDRVGSERKKLTIETGLSHRGLVLSPRARDACWLGIATWIKEILG